MEVHLPFFAVVPLLAAVLPLLVEGEAAPAGGGGGGHFVRARCACVAEEQCALQLAFSSGLGFAGRWGITCMQAEEGPLSELQAARIRRLLNAGTYG
jgi:hypothetical protein